MGSDRHDPEESPAHAVPVGSFATDRHPVTNSQYDWFVEAAGGGMEASLDPARPSVRTPRHVVKGGSFLCVPSYCRRDRPAARHAQMGDSGTSHIGLSCVNRPASYK